MKILHVETGRHLYGGAQQVVYLCNGLARRGIDNVLVCPPASGLDGAARDAGIAVINLKCAGDHDLGFAFRLRQRLMAERPDIVHCHSRRGADFLGGLAATGTAIPAVISRRVDAVESPLIAGLRYRPFRKVIAISEAIAGILRESGLAEHRLVVIRSAVDTERFTTTPDRQAFRATFGLSHSDTVAAVIAQLIPRKGHRYLLQAMAQLGSSHPALKLIVFGQGPLETELRRLTLQLGLGSAVQFAGFRPDLDDYLPCLDLLVQPSLAEGLGVAALKAAAAGIPVVGFAAGGLREVVEDGKTGLLVRPKDVEALRHAIASLSERPELRRKFGAAGRQRMQSEFSIDRMVERHRQLYETVLHGAG
jgi:glycosyltransferase involved in cell wall biosynthesis